jgi:hypothetical protein
MKICVIYVCVYVMSFLHCSSYHVLTQVTALCPSFVVYFAMLSVLYSVK